MYTVSVAPAATVTRIEGVIIPNSDAPGTWAGVDIACAVTPLAAKGFIYDALPGNVFAVVFKYTIRVVLDVLAGYISRAPPLTSQSPGVRVIDAMSLAVVVESDVALA